MKKREIKNNVYLLPCVDWHRRLFDSLIPIPDVITPKKVVETVLASDRLQRPGYTTTVERCFTECPVKGV